MKHRLTCCSDFEILIPRTGKFQEYLEKTSYVLDADNIDKWETCDGRSVGSFRNERGHRLISALAEKLSCHVGQACTLRIGMPAETIAAAWFFTIWTELCTLVPLRHLARDIHRNIGDRRILIPIDGTQFSCLSYWAYNELEPLILAAELRRRGACVFLYMRRSHDTLKFCQEDDLKFTFDAMDSQWQSRSRTAAPKPQAQKIFCPEAVRNPEYVKDQIGRCETVLSPIGALEESSFVLWQQQDNPEPLHVAYRITRQGKYFAVFSPVTAMLDLIDGLCGLIGKLTTVAWENAQDLVSRSKASEAHICDTLLFSSALLAHAVSSAGGSVHLWPHSSAAMNLSLHRPTRVEALTAITRSSAAQALQVFPHGVVRINSAIMLKPALLTQTYITNAPINVIFFAGAFKLCRMPALDFAGHKNTLKTLFLGLSLLPDNFRVLIKSKSIWEDEKWLSQQFPDHHDFEFTELTTARLDLPNMIFLTASFGSSALLEGIGKGVPGFVARNIPVLDYTTLDSVNYQVGTVQFVLDQLAACADPNYFEMVIKRQLQWYRRETFFPDL